MRRIASTFASRPPECSGELLLPADADRPPVVIMAHGFAAERDFGLEAFAERFVAAGLAVYAFDYRGFGASGGWPRQLVNPFQHLRDWQAALAHVRGLAEIDASSVALWGTSFAGGHVVVTAARDQHVRAVVAQVPFVSGLATLTGLPFREVMRLSWAGLKDLGRALTGRPPFSIGVVGRPGELAAMTTPEAYPGYLALVPPDSRWQNRTPARIALLLPAYNPIAHAGEVVCPVLVVAGRNDSLIPLEQVRKLAARIPDCQLEELDCNHFEPYQGAWFERNVVLQVEFLKGQLFG